MYVHVRAFRAHHGSEGCYYSIKHRTIERSKVLSSPVARRPCRHGGSVQQPAVYPRALPVYPVYSVYYIVHAFSAHRATALPHHSLLC